MEKIGKTTRCIKCGKKAKVWAGHVHFRRGVGEEPDIAIAGWCKKHDNLKAKHPTKKCRYKGEGCHGFLYSCLQKGGVKR